MSKKHMTHIVAILVMMTCVVFVDTQGAEGQATEAPAKVDTASVDTVGVDTLRVTVAGLKAGKGNIRVAVFDEAHREEFSEGKYLYGAEVPASAEQVTVAIANVPPGRYAIAVFQDLNKNKKLDRNFVTKPKEPYGFSGAWKSGGASYEEALFDTEKVGFAITIKLK